MSPLRWARGDRAVLRGHVDTIDASGLVLVELVGTRTRTAVLVDPESIELPPLVVDPRVTELIAAAKDMVRWLGWLEPVGRLRRAIEAPEVTP